MDRSSHRKRNINIALTLATVTSGAVAVTALRNNSQTSQDLYNALIKADQEGENVEEALSELREYIYSHMNTEIGSENGIHPPIQLQGTYTRLVASEQEKVEEANATIYDEAQKRCEAQFGAGSLRNGRVQCVENYVEENSVQATQVSPDLYRFDFEPPLWSPDVAGFALLTTFILGTTLLIRLVATAIKKQLS